NAHRFEAADPNVNEAARIALWECPDSWVVGYTTSRVERGPDAGKFVTVAYKPVGRGARSGTADQLVMVYERAFTTRKAAKARAESLYTKHSVKRGTR
ncbi:MAG: hypothetical protein ACRCYU_01950, partial [Nocardioides sp.]